MRVTIVEQKSPGEKVYLEEKLDDRAVSVALEAIGGKVSVIESSHENMESSAYVEEQPESDPPPTQDEPTNVEIQLLSSPRERYLPSQQEGEGSPATARMYSIKVEYAKQGLTERGMETSARDLVGTVQDVAQEQATRNEESTRLTVPPIARYHPETRLSHGKDEVETLSKIAPPQSSLSVKKQKKIIEVNGSSLFLGGSDDEDDDQVGQFRQQVPQIPAASAQKKKHISTEKTTNGDAAATSGKGKEKQKQDASPIIEAESPKGKEKEGQDKQRSIDGPQSSLEGRKKRKRVVQRSTDHIERRKSRKEAKRRAKEDDLAQDLNVDAMAHPTSTRMQTAKRSAGLEKLRRQKVRAERRRKGHITDSSKSSSESDSDSDDSSDTESIEEEDFIVNDDEAPNRGEVSKKGSKKPVRGLRRSLSPPSLVSKDYLSNVRSYPRRERLQEYIRWVAIYALDVDIPTERKNELEAVRTLLREKFRMDFKSLTSQSNRRQFTWYLKHYPYFERRIMTREEKQKHRGCASCHKTTQKCEHAFSVWGNWYNIDTLEKRTNSDYSSSALSTNAEDLKVKSKNEKNEKVFTFYLGSYCASFATIKHRLYHWERRVLNDITKLPNFKALRRQGEVEEDDLEVLVDTYYPKFSMNFQRMENEARNLLLQPTAPQRGRDKWDDDP